MIAKRIAVKRRECKLGRCAAKVVELTVGDLRCVRKDWESARKLTAVQKSAKIIVGNADEQAREDVSSQPTDAEGSNGKQVKEQESRERKGTEDRRDLDYDGKG